MDELTEQERQAFMVAASKFLAARERMELRIAEAKEKLRGEPGQAHLADAHKAMAPGKHLIQVLARIHSNHSELAALRFRGWLFVLTESKGGTSLAAIREAGIMIVDG